MNNILYLQGLTIIYSLVVSCCNVFLLQFFWVLLYFKRYLTNSFCINTY